jgi:hypothetical protein
VKPGDIDVDVPSMTISGVSMPKVNVTPAQRREEGYRRCDELAAQQRPQFGRDVDFATARRFANLLV